MRLRNLLIQVLTALMTTLALCQCGSEREEPSGPAASFDFDLYLPDPARLDQWQPDRKPRVYEGEDLYAFINGGAEIYHEYGFERVIVQDYIKGRGRITLEIYEMAQPEAAFGIWSLKKGSEGRPLKVSGSGVLVDYYANVWKGPFLFTLTGFDQSEETIAGLEAIAHAVDAMIEIDFDEPRIVDLLRVEGLVEQSVVYMTGPLALFNCQRLFTGYVFDAEEVVKGDYDNGCRVFVFAYQGARRAEEQFERVSAEIRRNPDYAECGIDRGLLRTVSVKGKVIEVCLAKKFLLLVLSDEGGGESAALRAALVKRIGAAF